GGRRLEIVAHLGFDASFLQQSERLARQCFAKAVRPGGVVLIEPWFMAEQWNTGRPTLTTYQSEDLKLARACVAERDGELAITEMHWLVAARARPVESFVERHVLWLCPHEILLHAFEAAGFETELDPSTGPTGRGLICARKPALSLVYHPRWQYMHK